MKDFLGNELIVGDEVVFSNQKYRKLEKAKILSFTKLYVNLQYDNTDWGGSFESKTRQLPQQLIKIK